MSFVTIYVCLYIGHWTFYTHQLSLQVESFSSYYWGNFIGFLFESTSMSFITMYVYWSLKMLYTSVVTTSPFLIII